MSKVRVSNGKETMIVQKAMIPSGYKVVEDYKEPVQEDLATKTEAQLKKVKNDDLKAYLDDNKVEYSEEATKDDLIAAIKANLEESAE
jgi:hypothetical protein